MTSQLKLYIGLSDITTVSLECDGCHASLTLQMPSNGTQLPSVCPACGEQWADLHNEPKPLQKITEFLAAHIRLSRATENKSSTKFSLTFGLRPETSSPASSGKD